MTNSPDDTEDYDALSPGELYMRHLEAAHGASDEGPTALFEAYEEQMQAARAAADAPGEDRDPDERGTPWSAEDDDTENTR
jgi:hypothetical protein